MLLPQLGTKNAPKDKDLWVRHHNEKYTQLIFQVTLRNFQIQLREYAVSRFRRKQIFVTKQFSHFLWLLAKAVIDYPKTR